MKKNFLPLLLFVVLVGGWHALNASDSGDIGTQSIKNEAITSAEMNSQVLKSVDVWLTSDQMNTLNATPVSVLAAGGSGYVNQLESIFCFNDYTSPAFELGSGTIDFRYASSAGGLAAQISNAAIEYSADSYITAIMRDTATYADNQAIVAYASADITAGGGTLKCRVFYRTTRIADI
jgi:hypothetical protein